MLGDHKRDKDMQRNHIIAILLMTVLVVVWFYLFPPPTPTPPPQPTPAAVTQEAGQRPELGAGVRTPAPEAQDPGTTPEDESVNSDVLAALVFDPETAPAQEIHLDNDHLKLVFTDIGARLTQGTVIVEHGPPQALIPLWGETPEDERVYPMSLAFQDEYLAQQLNILRWTPEKSDDGNSVTFRIELPAPYSAIVTKTFSLAEDHPNVLDVAISYTNTGAESRRLGLDNKEPAYSFYWGPNVNSGDEHNRMAHQEIVWSQDKTNDYIYTSKLERPVDGRYSEAIPAPDWLAIKSAFFVVAMKPDFEGSRGWVLGDPTHFLLALDVPRTEVPAGGTDTRAFQVYLGPAQGLSLSKAWPGLGSVLQFFTMFGFMDTFAKGMLFILNWFYGNVIANYGFAIIFLTILVRVAMFPLTLKGMKSMKKMQKLAPVLEEIKKEVGDDQQELQKRMMELYRERGVNPLGGCMPMLMQMPVFIALYRVYATAFEFRGAPFVGWVTDLSEPDALFQLPFSIPVPFTANGIDTFNLLPILMGLAMVASTKLMPTSGPVQNPQQKMIMTMMPIMFSVICYNMASGLNLYILTSTLLGIVQNYFVHVSDEEVRSTPGKKKVLSQKRRGKHFYNAAQDKKREMAREERREKKKKGTRGKKTGMK